MPAGRKERPKGAPFAPANAVNDVEFVSISAEASNVKTVKVRLLDYNGKQLAQRASVQAYLTDDANGDSIVATAPDGGIAAGTDGVVAQLVTGKVVLLVTEVDGEVDVAITHAAGAKTVRLAVILPDGTISVSGAITFA